MSKRPTVFLSNRLLSAAADARLQEILPITERAAADDVESFYWVILYVVYKHSLATLKASKSEEAQGLLDDEFSMIFSARDVRKLVEQRLAAFVNDASGDDSYYGIERLIAQLTNQDSRALRTLVAVVWRHLRLCPFKERTLDNPFTDLRQDVAEHECENDQIQEALGFAVVSSTIPDTRVTGNAGQYNVHHNRLMGSLKVTINRLEAERAL
ncbi:hypothetical protein TRAPUB_3165 [Trametes pubescens]|uniref:Uncharacterized protein n=1 Tax=Trametes pubescens TaxID=154538 RepID=A0A1M2VEK4_TRAPU|nr:hypothetical protein TRAPUB_3165 [Trametes pubescens]